MKDSLKKSCLTGLQKATLLLGGMLACVVLSGSASAANDTVPLTFTYTVTEGTCTIDVPSTIPFGIVSQSAETLDAMNKAWRFIGIRDFKITLSGCVGTGSSSTRTPGISIHGYTLAAKPADSQAKKDFIMMSAAPTTGLGMVITENNKKLTNGSTAGLKKLTGTTLTIDSGAIGTSPSTTTTSYVNLQVALACGIATDCTQAKLTPGQEAMTLIFSFGYH